MLKKIVNKFHLILFVLALTFLCGVFVVLYFKPLIVTENRRELIKPYEFFGDVAVEFADGTKKNYKMPAVIEADQPFIVELNLEHLGMIDNKTLTFVSKDVRLRCEVDDTIIFRYTLPHASTNYNDGNMMYFIDLPDRVDKSVIRLYYENDKPYVTKFELKDIKIGHRINIISHYFLKQNIFGVFLVILMFVLAFSIISIGGLVKNRLKIEYYFNYIAVLCILVGLYVLPQLSISYFVLYRYRIFLHIIAYTVPMLVPMVMLSAVMLRTDERTKPYLMMGIVLAAINLFTQHILVVMKHITLTMQIRWTYLVIIFATIVSIYAIKTSKDDENINKRMLFSIMPLFVGGLTEIALYYLNIKSSLSVFFQLCLFVFFIFQINEFFSFFIANRDKRLEAELYQKLAMQDKLTGLGNRFSFTDAKDLYKESDAKFYCIVFDIDNLKYMNDTFGHKYGDAIIIEFSKLLERFLTDDNKKDLFRVGGDEFVVFYHVPIEKNLMPILEALDLEYTSSSTGIEEGMSNYGVSYGYSYYDTSLGVSLDEVLDKADQLMYHQKKQKGISRRHSTSSS